MQLEKKCYHLDAAQAEKLAQDTANTADISKNAKYSLDKRKKEPAVATAKAALAKDLAAGYSKIVGYLNP